jgi:hypothetical protein
MAVHATMPEGSATSPRHRNLALPSLRYDVEFCAAQKSAGSGLYIGCASAHPCMHMNRARWAWLYDIVARRDIVATPSSAVH